ncbi:hypothetical protein BT96DRAFT_928595 [Gymnopus androsaceus JB14]|uniref:Uncharacterized protein n=1 Tax=Gymnopus androsaceus JB14 TaxID=1447944 RepID=A0A6A4GKQ7_9AGAR|nr:hypothetical protein BT96DRAFT_928595 [Gymnopus androsaceus JB14]
MAPDRPPLTIVQHLQLFDQILAGFETEDTQSPTTTSVGSATTYQAPNRPISLDQYAQLYKQVWDEFVTEDTQSPTTTSLGSATTYNASPYSKSFYSDSAELSAQPEISRIECFDDFESIYHDAPPVSASSYHHHHQSNGSYDSHDSHFIYTMSPISPGSSAPTTYARSTRSPSTRSNGRDRSGSERRLPLPPMRTLGPSSITSSTRKLPATPTSAPVSSGHERERVPLGVDLPANPRLRASPMRPRERNEQVGRSGPVDVPAYDWEYSSDNLDEHEYDSLEFANFSYLSHLAMHLRDIAPREVHMQGGIQYEKAFTGKDVVDTIQSLIKRHLLLNHSLNLTPFSYPSTAIDRKAALHVARSLQIQLWFFEVEGGGKELCDGVEDVYTFTDDSELPLAVVTMLTRCYVPTCFDDEPCYAWDCPKRGQSLHKMLAPPLLLLNNNSSTSFVPKVKSTAPLNTVKDLRGMQSYRDGENELSNVGVVDDGPSYNYDEYQRAATNESSSSSARRGRNQRIHRMVKLTATLQNTSTSHLISLSALIFTPHDSKVLVTAMEFAPTPYIKKLLESAFNLIGPLVYVKEVDFVLKHQPLVSALFSLVTVVINTYEDLHPPVEGINFLKSRRAEHGTSVGIQLPPRYQSSQPQSDLFSPDPALNRHVVEVIHMTKEIQTFIQKQGSRTFLQRFLDLSKSDKTMRDYTKRISQVLNAFLLQANITLESTISFSPAFLKTYYPTVNEISKQKLVDFLQLELDLRPHNDSDGTAAYYKRCMRDLSYLSANYQILPSSMIITDVTKDGRSPVNGGGFAVSASKCKCYCQA